MADLDPSLIRKLAEWTPGELQVVSLYLTVDGRRYPRKQDYAVRLDELLRRVRDRAETFPREARASLLSDALFLERFVKDDLERGPTRGLALFSCSAAGLHEEILLSRPVRDRIEIAPQADLTQLQALLEMYESFCTVLVDSEKARIFLAELGRIDEESDVEDEVPGRHDQGGWSQARFRRHIDDIRTKHLKRVAEVLFRFFKRRRFDHLILGGPEEIVNEFEKELHDYLRQRVRARMVLPIGASPVQVLERSLAVEEDLEREKERATVRALVAEASAGRNAVAGLRATLRALGEARAATLVVSSEVRAEGLACPRCGRLATGGTACEACGEKLQPVPDVVEAAVAQALRQGTRVEVVTEDGLLEELGGVGATLRF
ncbi:MAG: hypothetical protein HY658_10720 [Actinobacteria bacterium]|nr:hypothetical protein [Actinomycetota bacterium]